MRKFIREESFGEARGHTENMDRWSLRNNHANIVQLSHICRRCRIYADDVSYMPTSSFIQNEYILSLIFT